MTRLSLIVVFALGLGIVSCNRQEQKYKATLLFYYRYTNGETRDSVTITQISKHKMPDTLISEQSFEFKGNPHFIRMYTDDNHAPHDGGHLVYELDSLGIIYGRGTTWRSYTMLQSNNDSINALINAGLGTILLYDKLRCYGAPPIMKTIKFIPPEIKEK